MNTFTVTKPVEQWWHLSDAHQHCFIAEQQQQPQSHITKCSLYRREVYRLKQPSAGCVCTFETAQSTDLGMLGLPSLFSWLSSSVGR